MQLDSIATSAEKLNIFPDSALRIRSIVSRADTSFNDLEEAVSLDPTLTAQILKIANSPYFGRSGRVSDLRRALVLIGYEGTRDLALALALLALAQREQCTIGGFIEHSLGAALTAKIIAKTVAPHLVSEAFIAGLLHDIGKPIGQFVMTGNKLYPWNLRSSPETLQIEIEVCGHDHAELGSVCLRRWNLPEVTCDAIRYHHNVDGLDADTDAGIICRILNVADDVVHAPNTPAEDWAPKLEVASLADRITPERLAEIAEETADAPAKLGFDS